HCPSKQGERLFDVEAADRKFRATAKVAKSLARQLGELRLLSAPGEQGDLGLDRLRIVVRERRDLVVPTLAGGLEPRRERGVQSRPVCLRQTPVDDLPRQRVLEDELGLAVAKEAKRDEPSDVVASRRGQCREGRQRERASDHRSRLKRRLLRG